MKHTHPHARTHTHTRLLKYEIFQESVSARGVLSQHFLRLHVCHCI